MFGAIALLFFLPWIDRSPVRSTRYRPIYKWFFWLLVIDVFVLGLCGMKPPEGIWVLLGQLSAIYYFAHFLIILPIVSAIERPLPLPMSITESVLGETPATSGHSA
jgi:ubiquinol-cytochrome c reductase cytochrome b subunit